jgi:membrane protein required for colicin V production
MAWADWAIIIVLALSVLGGLAHGFLRAVCALGGLLAGLVLAAWNYAALAALILPLVRLEAVANALGFLVIALLVMGLADLLGKILSKTLHRIGLGCLDRMAGAVFGFFQGVVLVTLCILVTLAFFPKTHWLDRAKLPPYFFGACHLSMHMSPAELAERVRLGLNALKEESPRWLHPGHGVV